MLPRRTREALDEMVDTADAVLAAAVDRILGRAPDTPPVALAWEMDDALDTLRQGANLDALRQVNDQSDTTPGAKCIS